MSGMDRMAKGGTEVQNFATEGQVMRWRFVWKPCFREGAEVTLLCCEIDESSNELKFLGERQRQVKRTTFSCHKQDLSDEMKILGAYSCEPLFSFFFLNQPPHNRHFFSTATV
ncbi:hypothetical protein BaRGS_00016312 [Batillaria attramentaria]|uniref:Uncharacterized protein n=1 Tax=Batillaria attramentaria TaxID=370345 RepID=A0ABD0KZ54_9CAEN